MNERELTEQIKHDLAIKAVAQQLGASRSYTVHVNPGAECNVKVGGEYPDIVVTERGSGTVKYVMEVETISSVGPSEVEQWKRFAAIGVRFYLLVPYRMQRIVRQLWQSNHVNCRFGYYTEDESGRFRIVLKKER